VLIPRFLEKNPFKNLLCVLPKVFRGKKPIKILLLVVWKIEFYFYFKYPIFSSSSQNMSLHDFWAPTILYEVQSKPAQKVE